MVEIEEIFFLNVCLRIHTAICSEWLLHHSSERILKNQVTPILLFRDVFRKILDPSQSNLS